MKSLRKALLLMSVAVSTSLAFPAAAQKLSLGLLDGLERGDWELRDRSDTGRTRVCLGDAQDFIQLRHEGLDCRRIVVEDSPHEVIVQYTCPGKGYGRTSIRRETSRLVQIESQGIAEGRPFAFAAEARRVGPCGR